VRFLILLLCFVWLETNKAEGQVYKWTDASGQTHYGNVAVPASAKLVKGKVPVIDLRADNQAASRALSITERRLRPHYSHGAVFVLGERPVPTGDSVMVYDESRLRAVPIPFNAYARPLPYGQGTASPSSGARLPLYGQAVRVGRDVQVFVGAGWGP
jgi:hypothetical protein